MLVCRPSLPGPISRRSDSAAFRSLPTGGRCGRARLLRGGGRFRATTVHGSVLAPVCAGRLRVALRHRSRPARAGGASFACPGVISRISGGRRSCRHRVSSRAIRHRRRSRARAGANGGSGGRGNAIGTETKRLEQRRPLPGGELARSPDGNANDRERSEAGAPECRHGDAGGVHHAAHDVEQTLVDDDCQEDSLARFSQEPELVRHDEPAVDRDAGTDALHRRVARSLRRQDVILLRQRVARVHHPVRDVAVVGEQQEPFGVPVKTPDRVDALSHRHEIHHGAAAPLVAGGGDVPGRLIEEHVPENLGAELFAVDTDVLRARVDLGSEFGHDAPIHRDATGNDQRLCSATRTDAACGEDPLEPLFRFDGSLQCRATAPSGTGQRSRSVGKGAVSPG